MGFVAARDDAAGAEVGDLDLAAVADEEVGRLHVAVRDAEAVQVAQATEHAPRDAGDGGLRRAPRTSTSLRSSPGGTRGRGTRTGSRRRVADADAVEADDGRVVGRRGGHAEVRAGLAERRAVVAHLLTASAAPVRRCRARRPCRLRRARRRTASRAPPGRASPAAWTAGRRRGGPGAGMAAETPARTAAAAGARAASPLPLQNANADSLYWTSNGG